MHFFPENEKTFFSFKKITEISVELRNLHIFEWMIFLCCVGGTGERSLESMFLSI